MELNQFSDRIAQAVEQVSASIVAVRGRRGIGSSGIVWRDNLIVTSSEGIRVEEGIHVRLPDGTKTTARLRGRDSESDLALIEAEVEAGCSAGKAVELAAEGAIRTGQVALAVGRTVDTGPIASFGIVSGVSGEWKSWRGAKLNPFVRLDITAYPTLSGAAVLSPFADHAAVIGLVSTGLSRSSVLAVAASTIARVVPELLEKGYVRRGFLGVALQPVRLPQNLHEQLKQETGVILVGVEPDGPAAAGGLLLGDVLVSAGGHKLDGPEALTDLLGRTPAGQTLAFQVVRAGALLGQDVLLGERPSRRR